MLRILLPCLNGRSQSRRPSTQITPLGEPKYSDNDPLHTQTQDAAQEFVNVLIRTTVVNPNDPQLQKDLRDTVSALSWSQNLASAILACLEAALRNDIELGRTVKLALEKVVAAAISFAEDHPAYFTLIALGVLVIIAPWVLEWLGFAEIGIIEDSWAALWQSRYAGYVPKGSLFSFFQRLGMILHRKLV